jgi:hypothetical protein
MRCTARLVVYSALALLCLLLTSRWWLPAMLPSVLDHWGVFVESIERTPEGDWRFSTVVVDGESLSVEIDEVDLPALAVYLWERFSGEWNAASIEVGPVMVRLREAGARADVATEDASVYAPELYTSLNRGLEPARAWIPPTRIDSLEVSRGAESLITVDAFFYRDATLKARLTAPTLKVASALEARFPLDAPWAVELALADYGLSAAIKVEGSPEDVRVEGSMRHSASALVFSATFGDASWLPIKARAESDGFDFTNLPPLPFAFAGGGAIGSVQLDRLRVNWREASFDGDARMDLTVDLSAQSWVDASGRIDVALLFGAGTLTSEALRFSLEGRKLSFADFSAELVEVSGRLDRAGVQLESLTLRPRGTEHGDVVSGSGSVDFESASLDLAYSASLGADWMNILIGQSLFVDSVELSSGRVSGRWELPEISAEVTTSLQSEATERIDLDGSFRLTELSALSWEGAIRCSGAELNAELLAEQGADAWSLEIARLQWTDPDRPTLNLVAPARLRWLRGDGPMETRVSVSPLVLEGADLEVAVAYSPEAGLQALLKNVSLARLDRWLQADLPAYYAESIDLSMTRFRPYLEGVVRIAAEEAIDAAASARLEMSAELRERGIDVENVRLQFSGEEALRGQLKIPVRLRMPGGADAPGFYEVTRSPLSGQLKGRSPTGFTEWLEARTGLELVEASLDMELNGDFSRPVGHLNLRIGELGLDAHSTEFKMPAVSDVDIRFRVDESAVVVEQLDLLINKSPLSATMQIPVDVLAALIRANDWTLEPWLAAATGSIRLDAWEVEDWVDWLPPYLRRSGILSGALQLEAGLAMQGELQFTDFGLRPTASLPAVDSIVGRIRFADQVLTISEVGAEMGGSPVELIGRIDLSDWKQPLWNFQLQGLNVPIIRTTEMILRSDLDLRLQLDEAEPTPLVAGALKLRSGTLLVDFDPLAPSLQKGPGTKPPFFRVAEGPFMDWRFDLKATGEQFMRIRSPYFRTVLSANLDLKGSFAFPELTGSVQTRGGELQFPGAKFVLDDGEAFIEPSRPDVMQLNFTGIAQKSSRVIVMEVSHRLDDPHVQFQSTPPMSNADIVRFLATGSTTGGGLGNVGLYLGQSMLGAGSMDAGFADKLTVDIGESTTRSGRSTLGIRYEWSPTWSVEGEYDVYDAYNADLIWSIFKR